MSEQQPEYVWAYSDEKPRRGRMWLIVGLAAAAITIAAVVFWMFLRPGLPAPEPTLSPSASLSPTHSATPSPTSTPTPTPTPTPTATPTSTPVTPTPPPVQEPGMAVFRESVSPVLDAARQGLQFAAESDAQEAAQNVGFLQEDAGRLAELVPPKSVSARWNSALDAYARSLQSLRNAYERSDSGSAEHAAATKALGALTDVTR